ncbi:phage protein [Providencia heimbachae ATCC 35613]|uniref:Phage protein n=2 Tax=Providencia heimbachae TaxID=333962 RepID=A0A1B7K1I7_9GAMM|nr:phage protein [Providencia heimbachae ATCC 35613]
MLLQLPSSARNRALVAYSEVYQRFWDEEPVSYRKDNFARHEANTRLRRFVRRLSRSVQGYTSKPLTVIQ